MESQEIDLKDLNALLLSEEAVEFGSTCCSNSVTQTSDCSAISGNLKADARGARTENEFRTVTLYSGQGCTHEVVHRVDEPLKALTPISKPVHTYPFKLDPFQKQAILCVHNGRSVLVSACTSAGKTSVAEYAVARSLRENRRVIYTTPIKALSNQKYREFSDEFKDVGLMTGDVSINTDASVLIMVTEVLRSMLYRGSDATRRVAWVIFDEIQYLRNKERGVVWEEAIILLPDDVGLVFLSATIPNAIQFAEWIVALHHRPCHVVSTYIRPVPLEHCVFPCGGDDIHLVFNQKREFLEANFNAASSVISKELDICLLRSFFPMRRSGCQRRLYNSLCLFVLPLLVRIP
ncbi:unnamed protein product [Dicrocoelium dendriticum]|nr:unnamed protein product [Dicrocoelium dendriticum]CAH8464461.1 unnamed protein product [Dicrocoelium dendriticum]